MTPLNEETPPPTMTPTTVTTARPEPDSASTISNPKQPAGPEIVASPNEETDPERRIASVLWMTTLGISYQEFLFTDYPLELFPRRCEQLALRIASDTKKLPPRIAALQMLNEDLYVTGRMNEDVRSRIQLLEAEISKDRQEGQRSAVKTVANHIPFLFLASLPWGSPLIRSEIQNFQKAWSHYVISRAQRISVPRPPAVKWRQIFSKQALNDYEIGQPMKLFFQTVGPFSVLDLFLVQDVAGNLVGEATIEEIILMADL